jgi:UPF0042 nucleotide-binding protein
MQEIGIIIISGLSGSGKSTALKTLEDLGFYCVDNLPIILLPEFIELCQSSSYDMTRAALGMDVRERTFLKAFQPTLEKLRNEGYRIELIFLECSDEILIQRFSETRRQHPLSDSESVLEGIKRERELLKEIKAVSDRILDTSELNVHQLRNIFQEYFVEISKSDMAITFMSFGFKYGVPHDIDLVFDVRFLPNPYFVRGLKHLDGNDEKVASYIFSRPEAKVFLEKLIDFLSFQLPLFEREGKSYLTVAFGCTGGKHRSVAIASYLKKCFLKGRDRVHVLHRDLEK